jgi:Zn-dependent peptidase ImmA (M78 family)
MNSRIELARQGLRAALETRRRAGKSKSEPICVFDLTEALGVEVKFCSVNSLGGMYAKASQTILIPALHPRGRQAFTCAHELGHWFFGHGMHIDELDDMECDGDDRPEERLANHFASYLLMPPWAVQEAFARRTWNPVSCTPTQAYIVAGQLGVGYSTLVQHMRWSLRLILGQQAEELLKATPQQLRRHVLGHDATRHLVIADCTWSTVAIDLQVGDVAILPQGATVEGASARVTGAHEMGVMVTGITPGISRAESADGSWAGFVRVSRKDFAGRSIYRFLEDPDVG